LQQGRQEPCKHTTTHYRSIIRLTTGWLHAELAVAALPELLPSSEEIVHRTLAIEPLLVLGWLAAGEVGKLALLVVQKHRVVVATPTLAGVMHGDLLEGLCLEDGKEGFAGRFGCSDHSGHDLNGTKRGQKDSSKSGATLQIGINMLRAKRSEKSAKGTKKKRTREHGQV
jgi:hypothetical protein